MWNICGFRISRNAIISYCFVTCVFSILLIIITRIDRGSIEHHGEVLYAQEDLSLQEDIPGTRSWKTIPRHGEGQEVTFQTSPYNWDNRKRSDGSHQLLESPPSEKVISWQASKTMRVRSTSTEMFKDCPVNSCKVSPSDKVLGQAAALVYDDDKMAQQTPPQLKARRVLIYYSMKTPSDVSPGGKSELFGQYWTSALNWVWSYRLDSDIFEPFGFIKKAEPTKLPGASKLVAAKYKLALWINPHINRRKAIKLEVDKNLHRGRSDTGLEEYMDAFKTMVSFDSYGIPDLTAAFNPVVRTRIPFSVSKYYFVLAFEWVDCVDYLSDVVLFAYDPRILAVPVIRGNFSYAQHLPRGSYVNADAYSGPEELAKYLKMLAGNKKMYSEMLLKKMEYARVSGLPNAWCQLCEMLHRAEDDRKLVERIDDVHAWFREGGPCVGGNTTIEEEGAEFQVV